MSAAAPLAPTSSCRAQAFPLIASSLYEGPAWQAGADAAWPLGPPAEIIDEVDFCLSQLGAARSGRPLVTPPFAKPLGATPAASHFGASATRDRLRARLTSLGPPPSDQTPHSALQDLLRSADTVHLARDAVVRPYEADKVRLMKEGIHPRPMLDLISGRARELADDAWRSLVRRDANEVEDLVEPYTDPALRDPKAMRDLIRRLHAVGLVGFRRRRRGTIWGVYRAQKRRALTAAHF